MARLLPSRCDHVVHRWRRVPLVALISAAALVSGAHGAGASRSTQATRHGTPALASASQAVPAYWAVARDGGVFTFGGLPFYGSMGGRPLDAPMVGIAPTMGPLGANGLGYWTVASDGGIFTFGNAPFLGSMGGHHLDQPMVGMAADPATGGYWTVASDGGVFAYGAPFFGSTGGIKLTKPVVAMAATPDGGGYWLFASDGGVFAYGDAQFFGSLGSVVLAKPIVSAAVADAGGYWLLASDGGVFAFGDAPYLGSLGGHALSRPVVAIASADALGYWTTDSNGAVTAFGDAGYFGSAPQHISQPVVGLADGPGTGVAANGAFPSGSYGYDISRFQDNPPTCNTALPSGHTVGIVEATGAANANTNPCLAHEASWAGAGLNLYIFLSDGTDATDQPGCNGDDACNWGYEAGRFAYQYAQSVGVNAQVPWWLDVEPYNWSSNTAENDQVIQGALNALRDIGINTVGIYTSPLTWNGIAGHFQPAVPLWVAWYTNDPQANCANAVSYAAQNGNFLPTGGVFVTQYTNQANGQSLDGDYAC
ncbi:MAG TPA: hypothetical protein VMF60_00115 [Acidimicrobiales bacterium]|nr:hypothetical protein [Acidimicrobiales bacterium]